MNMAHPTAAPLTDQQGCCYWFTGLSGAGKSTLANHMHRELRTRGIQCVVLDGDRFRQGLNRDLGFSREDRRENVRRIAEVAAMMADAGLIVLVSAIAPYESDRQCARDLFTDGTFFEVYVNTDLETCAARDPKSLYARVKAGEIQHFTGWDDPYEAPTGPDFIAQTSGREVSESAAPLLQHAASRVQHAGLVIEQMVAARR